MSTIKHWVTGVIVCCLFNLYYVQSSQAQGCIVCEDGGVLNYDSMTIELPGYPGCSLTIDYTWKFCPDGLIDYQVYGFWLPDPNDPDCAWLISSMKNPDGSPNWAGIDAVFLAASRLLPQILFMRDYNGALPQDKQFYECPNGRKTYSSRYAPCRRWIEIHPFGDPHKGYVKLESCNSEGCCIETRSMCFNKATGQLEVQVTNVPSPAIQCEDLPDPKDPFAVNWSRCMMFECPE